MESEERPAKIRKLSHDASVEPADVKMLTSGGSPDFQEQAAEGGHSQHSDEDGIAAEAHAADGISLSEIEIQAAGVSTNGDSADPPLSKSQQKKLKRKAEWEAKREDRKHERKAKLQAKRERKREAKQQAIEQGIPLPEPAKAIYKKATQLPITIMIDCDFDDLMHDGERTSLASQVTRSYSDNKNSPFRAHLTICSFGGKLRERFETVLAGQFKAWRGVRTFDENFVQTAQKAKEWMTEEQGGKLEGVFSKYKDLDEEAQRKLKDEGEVVYLSSEGTEDLLELKPYSTYIIGGLVDKNREKGICHRRATNAGVKTARLPIGHYMDMSSRKVLATNHVNEILVKWLECGDWGEAFFKVMPKRKGGKLKTAKDPEGASKHDDEADEDAEVQKNEIQEHQASTNIHASENGTNGESTDARSDRGDSLIKVEGSNSPGAS
ncbi:tRNA (guanine(9)-N1)-methyltransferase [Cercospora beticola]|uniref:tRNA (guanine(9)-N1)-methyltransferase n=1 Tax=Cercospora beticola TaxID=122368 RepID=A0A2G5I981_CERBT|nr:tRNA (guanine(9)-N1)-methyltransferase [Cercospora beticola]PIB01367.1 tRNA (guanine(9)-N1)-methyltransferase [Cercospora beticola]WPA97795.1 hypothetical protein RHO25_002406 [Cercospora beticola]CAK1359003.1 unnamed protein product [Cercospora beticola]